MANHRCYCVTAICKRKSHIRGELELQHRTPDRAYRLATVTVTEEQATPSLAGQFEALRHAPELEAERQGLDAWLAAPPDKTLALIWITTRFADVAETDPTPGPMNSIGE